ERDALVQQGGNVLRGEVAEVAEGVEVLGLELHARLARAGEDPAGEGERHGVGRVNQVHAAEGGEDRQRDVNGVVGRRPVEGDGAPPGGRVVGDGALDVDRGGAGVGRPPQFHTQRADAAGGGEVRRRGVGREVEPVEVNGDGALLPVHAEVELNVGGQREA